MNLANNIDDLIARAQRSQPMAKIATQAIPLLDLTSLNETETEADIIKLCQNANTPLGNVAAVCIYPPFIKLAKQCLQGTSVKVASVANFPHGNSSLSQVQEAIHALIQAGADEIDLVIPYQDYLKGQNSAAIALIQAAKALCGNTVLLKVIIETGELQSRELITKASYDAIHAGADFIKTSTGKVPVNATLEAAALMLMEIKKVYPSKKIGFKAAGGIRDPHQAAAYLHLAELIMGPDWITPTTFRFGASSLLNALVNPTTATASFSTNTY